MSRPGLGSSRVIDAAAIALAGLHRGLLDAQTTFDVRACAGAWWDFETTLSVLADADAETLARAPEMIAAIDTRTCPDQGADSSSSHPKSDEIAREIVRAQTLSHASRLPEARAAARAAVDGAVELDDRKLHAEALLVYGELEIEAGELENGTSTIREAAWMAEAARNDEIAADA